jgi:hypothetical protein
MNVILKDFLWLLHQPWFAVSPSPWSLAFYALFGLVGARILLAQWPGLYVKNNVEINNEINIKSDVIHNWRAWLRAFLDALFLLFMIVMIQDSIWLLANTAKWIIPLYSGVATFWNYYVRFPENILAFMLFGLLSYGKWRLGVATFNWKTLSYLLIIVGFTSAVFFLAPNQAWTDWTFAVSHHYSDQVILESFLISHVGYKSLIALAFLSLFAWRQK